MKYKILLIFSALCLCIACQKNLSPGLIGRALGPEKQQFTITPGQDTIIRCKGGMVLRFCPNTFISTSKKLTLEVQEVQDRGEAYLLGLSTITSDGRLLETEGMLYLNALTSDGKLVTINPDCPVQLEIPVKGRRAGVKWFKGNVLGQGIAWEEIPGGLENKNSINTLETGQQLFKTQCSACHCPNMTSMLTGPALGNISQFRDKNWLQQFTRNSQELISSGDSLAVCMWNKWKPSIMPDFRKLTDVQIDAIYKFIDEESARLNVQLNAVDYSCLPMTAVDAMGDSAATSVNKNGQGSAVYKKPNPYFAKIYDFGWHNCDRFLDDSTAQPAIVQVSIANPEQYDEVIAGILFDALNANIQMDDYGNGQFETWREWQIKLPPTPARLVVIAIKGKQWFQYEQPFLVSTRNAFKATMVATTAKKIDAYIRTNEFKAPQVIVAKQECLPMEQ